MYKVYWNASQHRRSNCFKVKLVTIKNRKIMSIFRLGTKVKVGNGFIDDKYNPKGEVGTIISFEGEMNPIIVLWENGIRNSYQEKNLLIV